MPQQYTVKSGDTLSQIGQQFGVDWHGITGYGSNPNLIRPGQVLTIPGDTSSTGGTPTATTPIGPSSQGFQQGSADNKPITNDSINSYQDNFENKLSQTTGPEGNITDENIATARNDISQEAPPTPPIQESTYTNLASQYGLSSIQSQLTSATQKRDQIIANLSGTKNTIENQPGITSDVVSTRESVASEQADNELQTLNSTITALSNQYNMANSTIGMIMQFQQTDYENASKAYDDNFNHEIQYQTLLNSEASNQQKIASANWSTIVGLIQSGAINADSLNPEQKSQINNFELQAGIPSGITEQIATNPQIESVTPIANSNNQAIIKYKNGSVGVTSLSQYGYTPPSIWQSIGNWLGIRSSTNDNQQSKQSIINTLQSNGYTQQQIQDYLKQKGIN